MNPIAITGMGLVTPLGDLKSEFWLNLINDRRNFSSIPYFDTGTLDMMGGIVSRESLFNEFPFQDRCSCFLAKAIRDCLLSAGLDTENSFGLVIGTTSAGIPEMEAQYKRYISGSTQKEPPVLSTECLLENMNRIYRLEGYTSVISTACASGCTAIGLACNVLNLGHNELVLAGGVDTIIESAFWGMNSLKMLSNKGCKPFHAKRRGIILSEGAGVLALETIEHAIQRNSPIYGEVLGFGSSNSASHLTRPDKNGIVRAIEAALDDAGIQPRDVSYVNAHGSGTLANDQAEIDALVEVFGESMYHIPISSIKATLGHMQAACGSVEAIATILALHEGCIPPTGGLDEIDPQWTGMDFVPTCRYDSNLIYAISISIGFGGDNACAVFRKVSNNV